MQQLPAVIRLAFVGELIAVRIDRVFAFAPDHALDAGLLGDLAVHQQIGRLDGQGIARHTAKALDVVRTRGLLAAAFVDAADAEGVENKHLAAVRFAEVIGKLVHQHEIAGIDDAFADDRASRQQAAGTASLLNGLLQADLRTWIRRCG